MRYRIMILIVSLFALPILATSPSEAVSGCPGKVRTYMSGRTQNTYFVEPLTANRVPLAVTSRPGYWHCPNGAGSAKMSPQWAEHCWSQVGDETNHRLFDGITFNLRLSNDNGTFSNPDPFKVGDDGTRQNCRLQNFGSDNDNWTYYFNDPKWAGGFTVNLDFMNDQHHEFGENAGDGDGTTFKYFKPGSDTLVRDWWE